LNFSGSFNAITARLRSLFSTGTYQSRDKDKGLIRAAAHTGRVYEKPEAFPYGFAAKAKKGRVLILCQGGNPAAAVLLPVIAVDVTLPALEEGDAVLYAEGGGYAAARADGSAALAAAGSAKVFVGNGTSNTQQLLIGLVDVIEGLVTAGPPPRHTVSPDSLVKLEAFKEKIKALFSNEDKAGEEKQ